MTCRLLHVAQRNTGVEGRRDERMAEGVRTNRLVDSGLAGEPPDDPPCGVAVEPLTVPTQEDRALHPLADGQVERTRSARGERDDDDLAPFPQHSQGAMAAFHAECRDVGAERLRDPQAVDGQERDEGVLAGGGQPCRYEERANFVAVQAGGVGLVVEARAAHMGGR